MHYCWLWTRNVAFDIQYYISESLVHENPIKISYVSYYVLLLRCNL